MGDELACDFTKIVANEEDSSINIVSDEETAGFLVSPHKEQQNGALQSNTKQDASKPLRESKQGGSLFKTFNHNIFCLINLSLIQFLFSSPLELLFCDFGVCRCGNSFKFRDF